MHSIVQTLLLASLTVPYQFIDQRQAARSPLLLHGIQLDICFINLAAVRPNHVDEFLLFCTLPHTSHICKHTQSNKRTVFNTTFQSSIFYKNLPFLSLADHLDFRADDGWVRVPMTVRWKDFWSLNQCRLPSMPTVD